MSPSPAVRRRARSRQSWVVGGRWEWAARRRALTLVEMLVALAVTLILMWAVVRIFALVGNTVSESRANVDMAEQLRLARAALQNDLIGATATMKPPLRPEADEGYFEYVEGPTWDGWFGQPAGRNASIGAPNSVMGDCDDVLALTTRSRGEPFKGRRIVTVNSQTTVAAIKSPVAEVIWFTRPVRDIPTDAGSPPIRVYNLYRKELLVVPKEPPIAVQTKGNPPFGIEPSFIEQYDISARLDVAQNEMIVNSLTDLMKRENRFARDRSTSARFPFPMRIPAPLVYPPPPNTTVNFAVDPSEYRGPFNSLSPFYPADDPEHRRGGEDLILTNVLAFDVRVWDPTAPLDSTTDPGSVLVPSDVGYEAPAPGANVQQGAYVDLGYGVTPGYKRGTASMFAGAPQAKSQLVPPLYPTYDTWSLHYENNGINEDNDAVPDEGTNGLDDDDGTLPNDAVDDENEHETAPPYPHPLRGIMVKIRVYEPSSRQVRETSVIQDFLPE